MKEANCFCGIGILKVKVVGCTEIYKILISRKCNQ